jgi:FkbM family methyltransferase
MRKFKQFLYHKFGIERTLPNFQFENLKERLILEKRIDVVLDVGASVGHYTEAIRKLYPNLAIMAFEPLKEPFNFLRERFKNEPQIKSYNVALGNSNSYRNFFVASNNGESSSFYLPKKHLTDAPGIKFNTASQVEVKRLDSIELLNNYKSIFLKMDVQQAEWEVFSGLGMLINNVELIEIEVNFNSLYQSGIHPLQTLVNILSEGFEYFAATKARVLPNGQHWYCNALLVRNKDMNSKF